MTSFHDCIIPSLSLALFDTYQIKFSVKDAVHGATLAWYVPVSWKLKEGKSAYMYFVTRLVVSDLRWGESESMSPACPNDENMTLYNGQCDAVVVLKLMAWHMRHKDAEDNDARRASWQDIRSGKKIFFYYCPSIHQNPGSWVVIYNGITAVTSCEWVWGGGNKLPSCGSFTADFADIATPSTSRTRGRHCLILRPHSLRQQTTMLFVPLKIRSEKRNSFLREMYCRV